LEASLLSKDAVQAPRTRVLPRLMLGYLLAAACLVWVFHGIDFHALAAQAPRIDWRWALAAAACECISYVCQGLRWQYLLLPLGRIPVLRAAQAIYVGLLVNQLVPMRAGELARAYVAGRWLRRPYVDVLPSVLFSRVLDGAWISISIAVVAISVDVSDHVVRAGSIFAVFVFAMVVLLFVLLKNSAKIAQWSIRVDNRTTLLGRSRPLAARLALGFSRIGTYRILSRAAPYTLLFLFLQVVVFWTALRAYAVPLSFPASAAVFLIVIVGIAAPTAPTSVGPFQFFTVLALQLFDIEKATAAGFSIFAFGVLILPLFVLGVIALATSGVSASTIRTDIIRGHVEPRADVK
jgi:uncharacterized protein (TIRG00374 family)